MSTQASSRTPRMDTASTPGLEVEPGGVKKDSAVQEDSAFDPNFKL